MALDHPSQRPLEPNRKGRPWTTPSKAPEPNHLPFSEDLARRGPTSRGPPTSLAGPTQWTIWAISYSSSIQSGVSWTRHVGPISPISSGTKHVGARLTPQVLGQNMLGLVSPLPSPPRTEWGHWDKNTRGFLCKK